MAVIKNLFVLLRLSEVYNKSFFNFIAKRSGPYDGSVVLTRDRVYIVPTKEGLIFSVLLFILLIGSINYEKNLGFILTFLLVGIGNICLLATWQNLAGLCLKSMPAKAVFAGEDINFSLQLVNQKHLQRFSIAISYLSKEQDIVDCDANDQQLIRFRCKTNKRGLTRAGKFKLYTEFPTGLFIAWTWIDLNMNAIVYPAPDKKIKLLSSQNLKSGEMDLAGEGIDNFSHLRKYQVGDNIKKISWKAVAKNEELFTKEFIGAQQETLWVDWFEIDAKDVEARLSIMTAYIVNAEKKQQKYGLRLPDRSISPGHGNTHYQKCLTALALF